MIDMTLTDVEIKALLRSLPNEISSTARVIAILEKLGITDVQTLAELAGVSERMVRHARKQIATPSGNRLPKAETGCQKRKQVAVSETDCRPRAPARAHFDSNSSCEEVSNTPLPSVAPPAEKPKRVMGSRLPDDWTLPEDWFQWARINHVTVPAETVRAMGVKFGNYWKTRTDKVACKRRWDLAWQNWCDTEWGAVKKTGQPMNWGRNAYEQRQPKGIDWEAVDARVAELNRRSEVQGHA